MLFKDLRAIRRPGRVRVPGRTQHLAQHDVHFLNAGDRGRGHRQDVIGEREPCRRHLSRQTQPSRSPWIGLSLMPAMTFGLLPEVEMAIDDIARPSQGLDLTRKYPVQSRDRCRPRSVPSCPSSRRALRSQRGFACSESSVRSRDAGRRRHFRHCRKTSACRRRGSISRTRWTRFRRRHRPTPLPYARATS